MYGSLYGYTSQCLTAFQETVNTGASITPTFASLEAINQTFGNIHSALTLSLYQTALTSNLYTLQSVVALPLTYGSEYVPYIVNRINAISNLVNLLGTMLPNIGNLNYGNINAGNPVFTIEDPISAMWNFGNADVPTGLTISNLLSLAQTEINAWLAVKNAMETQNSVWSGEQYDVVAYMVLSAEDAYNRLLNLTISPQASPSFCWNSFVFLPTIFSLGGIYINDPTSFFMQDALAFGYLILNTKQSVNTLILQIDSVQASTIQTGTFMENDSLMTFASRTTGNFENWYAIAQANNLIPPFVSSTQEVGYAYPGESLFLPSNTITNASNSQPNYQLDYLGTDIYYGAMNQDMTIWTGDFQIISGYANLQLSLGRALQTPLNSLMYENGFGSRIPLSTGSVLDQNATGQLTAYANSALLFDPRVNSVINATSAIDPNTGNLSYQSEVIPNGSNGSGVSINEVINPA